MVILKITINEHYGQLSYISKTSEINIQEMTITIQKLFTSI